MQTIQINFWAKILTFETCSGDSIGIKSIIWRDIRDSNRTGILPYHRDMCVNFWCAKDLDWQENGLRAMDLDQFQVSFYSLKPAFINTYVVWMITDSLICSLNRYYIWNWHVFNFQVWFAQSYFGLAWVCIWWNSCACGLHYVCLLQGSACQGPLRVVRGPAHCPQVDVVKLASAATPWAPVLVALSIFEELVLAVPHGID